MPTFQSLYDDNREALRLTWIAGREAAGKPLDTPSTAGLASADLVGHLNLIAMPRCATTRRWSRRGGSTTPTS